MIIDREHCQIHSRQLRETRDCTVFACAVATQIDYPAMHEYLAAYGRKPRQGLHSHTYHQALRDLGVRLTPLHGPRFEYARIHVRASEKWDRYGNWIYVPDHYRTIRRKVAAGEDFKSATVVTLAKELTEGTYLVGTPGHVLCLRDGVVHDWTEGKRHRVEDVYRVEL